MEKLTQKIKEIAIEKKFGKLVVEITYQRGEIKKATIKESDEVILIDK